jgi:drug/metabolite transporter (DMT)-like permease
MSWLAATLFATLFQSWRTAVQQRVRASLSLNAAGLVRYLYGLPVAIVILMGWCAWHGENAGQIVSGGGPWFFAFALMAGFAQIVGTNLLLMAFGYRNFVVGTAYAKTEGLQGAIFSFLLLGEILSGLSWIGIGVGLLGVLLLSTGGRWPKPGDLTQPAVLCGLGSGFAMSMTAIFVKMATQTLPTSDLILAALTTLVVTQAGQVLMQGGYLLIREPGEMRRVFATWRTSAQVGVLATLGSAGWFSGFALGPVALVRTVGQVEMFFTLGFSRLYLREQVKRFESVGLLLVGLGVALAIGGSL